MRLIQKDIMDYGPIPAIIKETPESMYLHTTGVFSHTPPPPVPKSKQSASGASTSAAPSKEEMLSQLFLTMAHAITITGWGKEADGTPYWTIQNSWSDGWGEKGFFKLLRGKNNLAIESSAYSLQMEGQLTNAGEPTYDASLELLKIMYPFLNVLADKLQPFKDWSPVVKSLAAEVAEVQKLVRSSADDRPKKAAFDKLMGRVLPLLRNPTGDSVPAIAVQVTKRALKRVLFILHSNVLSLCRIAYNFRC